jgi:hypothetical protein
MDYLQQHKDTLIPEFRQVWEAAGFKTSGTWEEVFGKSAVTDGIFMAWHISRYIGRVAEAAPAVGRPAPPERSTPSDATMPWASRRSALTGRTVWVTLPI